MTVSEGISPSLVSKGSKILHDKKCYTVMAIKSWADITHGKIYAFDLESPGKKVRISVAEGAKLKECK